MTPTVRNISMGQLPGCAPFQLLYLCSLAEYGRLEKALDS